MNPVRAAVAATLLAVVAATAVAVALTTDRDRALSAVALPAHVLAPAEAPPAPELAGISHFDNTAPLTLAGLRGKVVLVDFWTYTCINCRRTFPFLRALRQAYPDLVVLGVHSPEFGFEKSHANVVRALRELDVTWPVAEDPEMVTWQAFRNQYWPAKYLVDREGRVRYAHFGEGAESQVEDAVRALLGEGGTVPGARVGALPAGPPDAVDLTRETYFGGLVPEGRTVTRHDGPLGPGVLSLDGPVRGTPELTELLAGASVSQRFRARDVYATTSPAGAPVVLDVTLDGRPVPADRRGPSLRVVDGRTVAVLDHQDLLHLLTGPAVADGTLRLTARTAGARFFTFTYGG